jgi:hypothetical protein
MRGVASVHLGADGGLLTARPQVHSPRAPVGVLMPPDVLGHLVHQFQPKRPDELRVMMREVSLSRLEELLRGIACQLCPALAVSDPPVPLVDGQLTFIDMAFVHLACPIEHVAACNPGVHCRHDLTFA